MNKTLNRGLSLLLALALCLSLLTGISITASAATVNYQYGSTSKYSNFSNIIKNWGTRGETATFLSPNAKSYYANNGTSYSALSKLAGSSNTSSVPSSALYLKLQELMKSTHKTYTNYANTRDLYAFTDCQENDTSTITCFYCGKECSSTWDSGVTYNREHTWPKSKSLNGDTWSESSYTDETDITMLRPACPSENTSRSNDAYGESSSCFNPNKFASSGTDNRGDAARSLLYGYVRWGNTTSMWGTGGVMESRAILLNWMKEDPVDTWEMGRNDSVESITGSRNVFIDYPELAFIMLGASVPTNYESPSSGEEASCSHTNTTSTTVNATCTENGSTTVICKDCGKTLSTNIINATGHNYISGVCTACGATQPEIAADSYVLVTEKTATAGSYIIGAVKDRTYPTIYPGTAAISGDWAVSATSITVENDAFSESQLPVDAQVLTLTGDNETGFSIGFEVDGVMKYLGYTSTTASRKLALDAKYSTTLWKIVADPDGGLALSSNYGSKNYTISQNSTKSDPIRGYYTGTIYTGIYLFRRVDVPVEAPKVAQVGDITFESFEEAYTACSEGQYIKLLAETTTELALNKDLYIDLNGKQLNASVTANGFHIYGMDCQTQNVGSLVLTGDGSVAATAQDSEGNQYLAHDQGNGSWSFHYYVVKLTHVSLDAANDALGYKAQLIGDAYVQQHVVSFGFHMSVENGPVKTYSKDGMDSDVLTLRLKNIMKAGGGEMEIHSDAFVIFDTAGTVTSDPGSITMKDTILAVNAAWAEYSDTQQAAVRALYNAYSTVMDRWFEGIQNNIA